MRSLKIEELELVAGGDAGGVPNAASTKHENGNNGLGNGDQTAPGNSLENNKAENNTGGNTIGNPPGGGKFDVLPN